MSKVLELPDHVYVKLARAAEQHGQTPVEWISDQLWIEADLAHVNTATDMAADLATIMSFAGSIRINDQNGSDNDRIDADLAREYLGIRDRL